VPNARKEVTMDLQFSETTLPTLALWGIGLGAILIGFLIGYVDSNLRSAKLIESAEEKAEVIRTEAERRMAEAEELKAQVPKVMDDPGLLRLKNKNGMPSLEMNGVVLDVKNVSPEQKKRLIEMLSVIRPWIEGGQAAAAAQATVAPQSISSSERAPVQKAATPLTPSSTQPLPITKSLSEKDFKALPIIAQIDHVFQSRILGTPHEPMGIRIFEWAVGSVEVMVGLNKYPSIDDVPDAEIKKAIRAAIAEWEEKYTPGQ
jgi:hypothetical protein